MQAQDAGRGWLRPRLPHHPGNERTFQAWFRTALALIASGVAVVQLVPALAFTGARHMIGILLAVAGGGLSLAAVHRWWRVQAFGRRRDGRIRSLRTDSRGRMHLPAAGWEILAAAVAATAIALGTAGFIAFGT